MSRRSALAVAFAVTCMLAACDSAESNSEHSHTPNSVKAFVGTTELTEPYTIEAGTVTRVELKFYAEDGDEITGLETTHYASLTFEPVGLATVVGVAGQRFQFDVTAQAAPETGTVTVGFGHDVTADELTFGPFDVQVVVTAAR